jgi:hypothetical protein
LKKMSHFLKISALPSQIKLPTWLNYVTSGNIDSVVRWNIEKVLHSWGRSVPNCVTTSGVDSGPEKRFLSRYGAEKNLTFQKSGRDQI